LLTNHRTDKGVHAAGNVISLKLIIEDENIIEKINANLSSQIRVWGFERTVNSFSCYQACDSRWYEYLIPTHAFVPPHPDSYLGRVLVQYAKEAGDDDGYNKRQAEVENFWAETEETYVKPILESLDEDIRNIVMKAMYDPESDLDETPVNGKGPAKNNVPEARLASLSAASVSADVELKVDAKDGMDVKLEVQKEDSKQPDRTAEAEAETQTESGNIEAPTGEGKLAANDQAEDSSTTEIKPEDPTRVHLDNKAPIDASSDRKNRLEVAIKKIRNAYMTAKRAYRIPDSRKNRVAEALKPFLGTRNFHNYTVDKTFRDPSAQRHIKSFNLNPKPIVINGTEWLSIKIHGQSFMMHQIRKMISMIALTIRCGCPVERISESFRETTISIPKVPGLGLLLERPVFDSYNEGAASKFNREKIDFSKYEKEMEEFKQKEIYERIFREEADGNQFHTFFAHVDSFREGQFLYLTSKGLDAIKGLATTRGAGAGGSTDDKGKGKQVVQKKTEVDSDDEREHREDN
jgi:tRNA pseudouridine38-40 synthase